MRLITADLRGQARGPVPTGDEMVGPDLRVMRWGRFSEERWNSKAIPMTRGPDLRVMRWGLTTDHWTQHV